MVKPAISKSSQDKEFRSLAGYSRLNDSPSVDMVLVLDSTQVDMPSRKVWRRLSSGDLCPQVGIY